MEETIEHKGNLPTPSTTRVPHYENSSAPLSPPQKHDPIDRPQATNLMSTRIATQNAQRKTSTTESNARRPSEGKNNLDIRREKTPHHKKTNRGCCPGHSGAPDRAQYADGKNARPTFLKNVGWEPMSRQSIQGGARLRLETCKHRPNTARARWQARTPATMVGARPAAIDRRRNFRDCSAHISRSLNLRSRETCHTLEQADPKPQTP